MGRFASKTTEFPNGLNERQHHHGTPGHFGVALAAKPAAPRAALVALLFASEALDLLSFGFRVLGLETFGSSQNDFIRGLRVITPGSVPWTHGLLMSVLWSFTFGGLACLLSKDRRVGAVIGFVVFSHWLLDFIVHAPDLPLAFHPSPRLGLGLWTSGPGLIASVGMEFALFFGGLMIYLRWRKLPAQTTVEPA